MATETMTEATASRSSIGSGILTFLRRDRVARWTSRLALLLLWQFAGIVSPRFPTPVQTVEILVREFQTAFGSDPWSVWNNELVQNLQISLTRTGLAPPMRA